MPRYLLRLAYDGTAYVGWQRQANGVSIQQRLEEAAAPLAQAPVEVVGAGRTDAGVHALGQAAHLDLPDDLPADTVLRALNARLPPDIRVRRAQCVPATLHARHSASGKTYRYRWLVSHVGTPLAAREAWVVPPPLSVPAMTDAAARLVGTHDFAGFQSTGSEVARTIRCVFSSSVGVRPGDAPDQDERVVELLIAGDGFLRHMVRAIAGTLTEIGRNRWRPERIDEILTVGQRTLAGPTAPAQGLTLLEVAYRPDPTNGAES